MRTFCVLAILFLLSQIAFSQTIIFQETFSGGASNPWNGLGQDNAGWNVILGAEGNDIRVGSADANNSSSAGNNLHFNDCDEGFNTPEDQELAFINIDLSGQTNVYLDYYWQVDNTENTDGFRCAYSTNTTNGIDGTWTQITEQLGGTEDTWYKITPYRIPDTDCNANFYLRFSSYSNGNGEDVFIDDIMIWNPLELFAVAHDDWDEPDTWSLTSGGGTCGCTPDANSAVNIGEAGNDYTVNMNVDGTALSVNIYDGGSLLWTNGNVELEMTNSPLNVESGGTLDESGQANAFIEFVTNDVDYTITNNGTFDIDRIELENDGGSLDISGTGTINILDDLYFNSTDNDITLTNSTTINITDDILFDSDRCSLTNSGTINVTDDVRMNSSNGDDGNAITNSAGGMLNIDGQIDLKRNMFTLNNYGTIDLEGEWIDIDASVVEFHNFGGAVWYYAGDPGVEDVDMDLFCSYTNNTFIYDRGGNQDIKAPNDNSYWNLTLANSGDKETLGTLDINGNLSIEDAAGFDPSTGNDAITIAGNWTNTSSLGVNSFDQGTETVTFDGTSDQTVSYASGEIFYDLVVNKASGTLTLDENITASNSLTMTQGNIESGSNTIELGTNTGNPGTLSHTSGTIIGIFKRWHNTTGFDYLFPIGTTIHYRPVNINFTNLTNGSLIVEFIEGDPGSSGLDIVDGSKTVTDQYTEGYWDLTAANSLESTNYDIAITAAGFSSYEVNGQTRVLKRDNGGSWEDGIPGTHVNASSYTCYRTGITTGIHTSGTQFCTGDVACATFTSSDITGATSVCASSTEVYSVTPTAGHTFAWGVTEGTITSEGGFSTIWNEDFASCGSGDTEDTGPTAWTSSFTTAGAGFYFEVRPNADNEFHSNDIDGLGTWISEAIDISGYSNVRASVNLYRYSGSNASDSMNVYYNLDGAGDVLFPTNGHVEANFGSPTVASAEGLVGFSLVITITCNNNGEDHAFDDVLVEGLTADESITVDWGATGSSSANVRVIESSDCRTNAEIDLPVTINNITTSAITGNTQVSENSSETYSVTDNAYTYTWTITGGDSDPAPASGQGTSSITVDWGASGAGDVSVTASNALGCGAIAAVNSPVTINSDLYAIVDNGAWNDGNTWSYTSGSATPCGCTPSSTLTAHIGEASPITVDMNVNGDIKNLNIHANGILQYSAAVALNIYNGGALTIDNGGSVDRNGNNGLIEFEDATSCAIVCEDVTNGIDIYDINVNAATTLSISGSGKINIANDMLMQTAASTVTNSCTDVTINNDLRFNNNDLRFTNSGDITIINSIIYLQDNIVLTNSGTISITGTGDLIFDNDWCELINSGTFTIADDILILDGGGGNDDDNSITNSGTLTINGIIDFMRARFVIENYSTIDLNDRWIKVVVGEVQLYNYAGATFSYSGDNTFDTDLQLYADYDANEFIYDAAGNQDIVDPQDAYWNLKLATSGAKISVANLDINGSVFIEDAAILNPNTNNNNISIAGNWSNTSSLGTVSFEQGTETVTFDGATAATISNPDDTELFYNLVINKSTTSNALTLSNDIFVDNSIVFSDGHLVSSSANMLTLNSGASAASASNDSHVKGILAKVINPAASFTFPTGDGSIYRSISVTPESGTNTFQAEYIQSSAASIEEPTAIDHVSTWEYWTLDQTAGTANYKTKLSWNSSSGVDNLANISIANWTDSPDWDEVVSAFSTTGTVSSGTIETDSYLAYTSKYLAMGCDNSADNPLSNDRYSVVGGAGLWNNTASWAYTSSGDPGVPVPDETCNVYIEGADVITLDVAGSCRKLNIGTATNGTLTYASNNMDLDIGTGGLVIASTGDITGSNTGCDINISGDITVNSTVTNTDVAIHTDATSTISGTGQIAKLEIDAATTNTGTITVSNTININAGGLTNNGTLTVGTLKFPIDAMTCTNSSGKTMTITDLKFAEDLSNVLNYGSMTIDDISIVDSDAGSGNDDNNYITNYSSGSLTINNDVDAKFAVFTINNYGAIDLDGEWLQITAGEVEFYNYSGSTFNYSGDPTVDDNDIDLYCNYDANIFEYDRGGAQEIIIASDAYWNLTLSSSGTKTTIGNTDINNDLSISGSAVLDPDNGNDNLTIGGDWQNTSSAGDAFVEGTETVTFDGTSIQTINHSGGMETFYNIRNSNTSGNDVDFTSDATIKNVITIDNAANFDANGNDITIKGDWDNNEATPSEGFTSTGTVIFDGTTVQTIDQAGGMQTFFNVRNSNTSGNDVDFNSAVTIGNDLTIDDGTQLDCNNNNITIAGNWDNNDMNAPGVNDGFSEGTATVIFGGGSIVQTVNQAAGMETFYNVRNSNTSGNDVDFTSDVTISNNLTIDDVANFDANSNDITIKGNWDNNEATASEGFSSAGTVIFNGTTVQTIDQAGGMQTFYDIRNSNTSGNDVDFTSDVTISNDLTIDDGTQLDCNNNNITIAGDWDNNDMNSPGATDGFSEGTGIVTFNGIALQTIDHAGGTESFNNLTLTNSIADADAVSLSANINVAGTLTMTMATVGDGGNGGDLFLNGQTIALGTTGSISGESSDDHIYGATGSITHTIDMSLNSTLYTNIGGLGISIKTGAGNVPGSTVIVREHAETIVGGSNSVTRSFNITPTINTALDANLRIYYFDSELNGNASSIDMDLWRYNGSSWDWNGGIFVNNGTYDNLTVIGIGAFSKWTVSNNVSDPLPISLSWFNAELDNGEVQLSWSTASETNNDYFTIERSIDGLTWEEIELIPGAGNSNYIRNYSTIDHDPVEGISYYRLKQTDFDGQYDISEAVAIKTAKATIVKIKAYPNPTKDFIIVSGTNFKMERIKIYNVLGRDVTNQTAVTEQDAQKVIINLSRLSTGIYFIKTMNSCSKVLKE